MVMGLQVIKTFLFYPFFSMELLSQLEPQCPARITFNCFLASCSKCLARLNVTNNIMLPQLYF